MSPDKPGAVLNNPPSPVSLLLPFYCFPLTDYTLVWVAWYYYFPDKFPKVLLMLHLTFSLKRLILLCFIRFAPSGLRTRPEHKCPTIQRTLPHLKGWNLLNLIAWTEPAIFFLSMNFYLNGSPSRQRTLPISIKKHPHFRSCSYLLCTGDRHNVFMCLRYMSRYYRYFYL